MSPSMMLLRIYTDEATYFGDRRVFEVIAARVRDAKLAGATVLQALIGFGKSAHTHTRHILDDDQSIVIEIIDEEGPLRAFVATLEDLPDIGLVTLERVEVLRRGPPNPGGAAS